MSFHLHCVAGIGEGREAPREIYGKFSEVFLACSLPLVQDKIRNDDVRVSTFRAKLSTRIRRQLQGQW
jgi:hypothetical protein